MFEKRMKTHHAHELQPSRLSLPMSKSAVEKILNTSPKNKEAILYFHVPYCDKICSFCSMNRSKVNGELEDYTNYLIKDIEYYSKFNYIKNKSFESIYFGGGTPTVLKLDQLERIIKAINKNFTISQTCEFSFESTLHNLSFEKIKLMNSLGVNRLSIGVQTFSDEGRKLLNRTGSGNKAKEKLFEIRDIFKGNLCIDIIYNYPNQSKEEAINDALITKEIQADSVSFYSLMFHEGSFLHSNTKQDYYNLDTDKMLHDSFLQTMLDADKYEILELTKINKIGRDEYKYIRLSHKGVDMLPIGVGAGGDICNLVSFSPRKGMRLFVKESEKMYRLKIFVALFQYPIIYFEEMKKYVNQKTFEKVYALLQKLEKAGYMLLKADSARYTNEGIFWGNNISYEVLQISLKESK